MKTRIPVKQDNIDEDIAKLLLGKDMDVYVNRRQLYCQNKATLSSIVIGKCTEKMNKRLEVKGIFDDTDKDSDVIKILNLIKRISYAYESESHPFLLVHQGMKAFHASYQQKTPSCDSYMESITNLHDAIVHCEGDLGDPPFLSNKKLKDAGVDPPSSAKNQHVKTTKIEAEGGCMAVYFLSGLNRHCYGQLMNDPHNALRMGQDKYPKILTSAHDLEINWKVNT